MDRVVNFLQHHQHKILFVFQDEDTKRARFLFVLSRRKSTIFMIELAHGGVSMTSPSDPQDQAPSPQSWAAESSLYSIREVEHPPSDIVSVFEKPCSVLTSRFSSWGWDNHESSARFVVFSHPYMLVYTPSDTIHTRPHVFRVEDFEWMLKHMACFVMIRFEDFDRYTHTIHDRMAGCLKHMSLYLVTSVETYLKDSQQRLQWRRSDDLMFRQRLATSLERLMKLQKNIDNVGRQLQDLYTMLHDISLETLHIEDQISSIDNMVFQHVLEFGQKKRRLYKSMDQLRLLEKHVLEFLLSMVFQYDHIFLTILTVCLTIQDHMNTCETIMKRFMSSKNEHVLTFFSWWSWLSESQNHIRKSYQNTTPSQHNTTFFFSDLKSRHTMMMDDNNKQTQFYLGVFTKKIREEERLLERWITQAESRDSPASSSSSPPVTENRFQQRRDRLRQLMTRESILNSDEFKTFLAQELTRAEKMKDTTARKMETSLREKEEKKKLLDEFHSRERQIRRHDRYMIRAMDHEYQRLLSIDASMPDYMRQNLKNMKNNKGYIYRGVQYFGQQPLTPHEMRDDSYTLFEKTRGTMYIHEIKYGHYHRIYEKKNQQTPRVLIQDLPCPERF